jgi:two-component system response regulator
MPFVGMSAPEVSSNSIPGRLVEILLVDDDAGDVYLAQEAFEDCHFRNQLHVATDGEQAMAFLHRTGAFADAPRPDLILLDLNMPRMGGHEVLSELKSDPNLSDIPIVIVTGNDSEGEILKAYNLSVDCYITKPIDVTKLMIAVCSIPHFQVAVITTAPAL